MIVCLCKNVSDRHVLQAQVAGAATVADVERMTGAGSGCGSCRGVIAALLAGVPVAEARRTCSGACGAEAPPTRVAARKVDDP